MPSDREFKYVKLSIITVSAFLFSIFIIKILYY